ncbi:MAG: hypothetical protein IH861_14140 [Chloroflexi bacterium]|nr:hypothetical protein [Chloroflexota bacterium]
MGSLDNHGISIGVYLFDPDGNEIEVFYELPKDQWPKEGSLFEGQFPGDLEGETVVDPAWGRAGS